MAEEIKAQLSACVTSYRQIIDFFALNTQKYNYDNKDDDSAAVTSFLDARVNILSALISLNGLLSEISVDDCLFITGRICLAPRLLDGIHDVCVVTDIVLDKDSGDVSDVVIHWIYPRNVYELRSSGMTISVVGSNSSGSSSSSSSKDILSNNDKYSGNNSGLMLYTLTHHAERIAALQALEVGDPVLVSEFLNDSFCSIVTPICRMYSKKIILSKLTNYFFIFNL